MIDLQHWLAHWAGASSAYSTAEVTGSRRIIGRWQTPPIAPIAGRALEDVQLRNKFVFSQASSLERASTCGWQLRTTAAGSQNPRRSRRQTYRTSIRGGLIEFRATGPRSRSTPWEGSLRRIQALAAPGAAKLPAPYLQVPVPGARAPDSSGGGARLLDRSIVRATTDFDFFSVGRTTAIFVVSGQPTLWIPGGLVSGQD